MKRSSFVLSSRFSEVVALKRRSSKGGGILCCSFSFASSSSQYVSSSSSDAFLSRENVRSTWKNHNRGKEERWRTTKARSFSSLQSNEKKKKKKPNPRMSIVEAVSAAIGSFVIGSLAAYLIEQQEEKEEEEKEEEETKMKENIDDDDGKIKKKKDKKKNTWRRMFFKEAKAEAASVAGTAAPKAVKMYTRLDVAEHDSIEKRVWCSYKENVYDVTDFLDNHPGGRDLLLLAAGKDIEPFWRLYQAHVNSDVAMEMLKTLKIGELDLEKEPKVDVDETDPYKNDPERHPALKCHSAKPANMEPPLSLLRREYLTPSSLWFVRNHSPVPIIDAATHEITIVSGEQSQDNLNLLRTKAVINLEHLKKDFEKKTVVATVQCGGNRRGGLDLIKKSSGTGWGEGAISTAKFAGRFLAGRVGSSRRDKFTQLRTFGYKTCYFLRCGRYARVDSNRKSVITFRGCFIGVRNERLRRTSSRPRVSTARHRARTRRRSKRQMAFENQAVQRRSRRSVESRHRL
jgi:cytochrome b involved in lipid metabolism